MKELKEYVEEVFAGYNDINDDTRMQPDLINQALAELQSPKEWPRMRKRIEGFKKYEKEE